MLKERMKENTPVLGTMISELPSHNLPRMMKLAGYEYVIVDCEHGMFDFSQLSAMIAVGNAISLPMLIRIPAIEREFITKCLDTGADGFLVPMVNTREQAEKLVELAKYSPLGKRGISTTRAHTGYCPPKLPEYMKRANERTVLHTQIETLEVVENAEQIASVPGIDALIVGPSDLSDASGAPGEINSPTMKENVKKVCEAARKVGIVSGTVSGDLEYLSYCSDQGMRLFCVGSELNHLLNGAKTSIRNFRERIG